MENRARERHIPVLFLDTASHAIVEGSAAWRQSSDLWNFGRIHYTWLIIVFHYKTSVHEYYNKMFFWTYTRKVPLALILFMRSYRFMSVSLVSVNDIALALLITTSMPPNWLTARVTAAFTWPSSRTSAVHGRAFPPAASTETHNLWETRYSKRIDWNQYQIMSCNINDNPERQINVVPLMEIFQHYVIVFLQIH